MADSPTPNPVPTPTPVPPPAPVQPPSMPAPARPDPTHHDPSVEPHPTKSSTPIKIALIILFVLLLGAAAFLVVWPRLAQTPATTPTIPTTTQETTVPPLGETPTTTSQTPTTPTTPTSPDLSETIDRGSTDIWFVGDEKIIRDPKTGHLWSVKAVEFGDSRCPADVVCIWAGEQTVTLDIKDLSTGRTERIILGTSRGRTATANGLTLNLIEIDDGKGGVYAEIKVD